MSARNREVRGAAEQHEADSGEAIRESVRNVLDFPDDYVSRQAVEDYLFDDPDLNQEIEEVIYPEHDETQPTTAYDVMRIMGLVLEEVVQDRPEYTPDSAFKARLRRCIIGMIQNYRRTGEYYVAA